MAKTAKMTFSDKYWQRLGLMVEETGLSIQQVMSKLLDEELIRWEYMQRSKPREAAPVRPVGRPADPTEIKEAKELGRNLQKTLLKLKTEGWAEHPEVYNQKIKWLEPVIEKAIRDGDVLRLKSLASDQPWQSHAWPMQEELQRKYES